MPPPYSRLCFSMSYLKAQEIWMTIVLQQRLYRFITVYRTSDTFVIQQPVEAVVGSVSLPVHRFSVATGDSTTTRTRCWQFYFSGSRPEMCGTCILCFPLNGSKRIIECHRRSYMYWKRKPTFQGLWPHRRHRSVPPGDLGSYDLECGLSFPTSHPSTLGAGWVIKELKSDQITVRSCSEENTVVLDCTWKGPKVFKA